MTMIYSNPARESEPGGVPDVEVWEHRHPRNLSGNGRFCEESVAVRDASGCRGAGWYWQAGESGKTPVFDYSTWKPEGDPVGPFATEAEAIADAQYDDAAEQDYEALTAHDATEMDDDGAQTIGTAADLHEVEPQDITAMIGPIGSDKAAPMYSYNRPAYLFWQGAYDALIAVGATHDGAIEWLQSKHARWMLDGDANSEIELLGKAATVHYIQRDASGIVTPNSHTLPPCVLAMGCYCAGHARGNPASESCDTSEQ